MDLIGATNNRGNQREVDSYCWICHRDETKLFCLTCPRSFHKPCANSQMLSAEEMEVWQCSECTSIKDDEVLLRQKKIDATYVKDLLKHIFNLIKRPSLASRFMTIEYTSNRTGKIVHPMNMKAIGKKVSAGKYNTLSEFFSDISWIAHNTKVYMSGQPELITAAMKLLIFTKNEVHSARLCHECYINSIRHPRDWFTMVCNQHHILFWAKKDGLVYWPAKLMAVDPVKNTADVFFFCEGDRRAVLTPNDCFIYSRNNPSVDIPGEDIGKLVNDKKEAETYIQNLTTKFGRVNIGEEKIPLDGRRLDRHLYDLIPGAWKSLLMAEIGKCRGMVSKITKPAEPAAVILSPGGDKHLLLILNKCPSSDGKVISSISVSVLNESEYKVSGANSSSKKRQNVSEPNATEAPPNKKANKSNSSMVTSVVSSASLPDKLVKMLAAAMPPQNIQISPSCKLPSSVIANLRAMIGMDVSNETSIAEENGTPVQPPIAQSVPESMNPNDHEPVDVDIPEMATTDRHASGSNDQEMPQQPQCNPNATDAIQSPEFMAICDAIVKKNVENMTERFESSVSNALTDLLTATNPADQIRMFKMQMEYHNNKKKSTSAAKKFDALNIQLKKSQERENVLQLDLQNAHAKIAALEDNLNKKSDEKSKLAIDFDKLVASRNSFSNALNRSREESAKSVADAKAHSWCASCQKPGARYFCSVQCEDTFWGQRRT